MAEYMNVTAHESWFMSFQIFLHEEEEVCVFV